MAERRKPRVVWKFVDDGLSEFVASQLKNQTIEAPPRKKVRKKK